MSRFHILTVCVAATLVGNMHAQPTELPPPESVSASALVEQPAVIPCAAGCEKDGPLFWASADFLFAWFKNNDLPGLVTTSPVGTPRAIAGVPGPDTTTIIGGGAFGDQPRAGFRIDTGLWIDERSTLGCEVGFLILESQASSQAFNSNQIPILARPYIDATTGDRQAVLVAFPGTATGALEITASSGNLIGTNVALTENMINKNGFRMDTLFGYRFFTYGEGLSIHQTVLPTDPGFQPGTRIFSADDFGTKNEFHGGDFGCRFSYTTEKLSLGFLTKLAVGNLHRQVNITGSTLTTVPGAGSVYQTGGVYALASNIGSISSESWTLMPEFGINMGWQVRPHTRIRLGYTILLLAEVARAAAQVDQVINPNLFPPVQPTTGPFRPTFNVNPQDIWVQSLNLGLEFNF